MVKRIFLISCLLFPVAAWAIYKPVRVLAPELVSGVTCENSTICIDDISQYTKAVKLYDEAIQFVTSSVSEMKVKPRVIFCSTESCFKSFGFNKASAKTVGDFGIVISPRAWKYYYIRHEMIHHLQAEKMGVISQWQSPAWFTEGMAYFLSQDPRKILAMSNQKYRVEFSKWYQLIDKERLWEEPRKL